ncbi:hypothetical protein [Nostoc sp. GT001]|uniref:hypothetical protein n=1 Tax=Nostoc sp. GT001 TaxID=3056647 RepID=UPI0025AACBD5|nr:hypothetical protein [Nostoc sp. GT001]MDM9586061.1 hypothetical protein [Nostoc sp. GT001]
MRTEKNAAKLLITDLSEEVFYELSDEEALALSGGIAADIQLSAADIQLAVDYDGDPYSGQPGGESEVNLGAKNNEVIIVKF